MKYLKKSVEVEAVQLKWCTWSEVCDLINAPGGLASGNPEGCYLDDKGNVIKNSNGSIGLLIPTLEGLMLARENDWIIKGVKGEIYPCKPDIFELTYDLDE